MNTPEERLHYCRTLYETVLRWYDNADTKAKILLTLDGALVTFLSGSVFARDVQTLATNFNTGVWVALGTMALAMSLSILAGLVCLWSRTRIPAPIVELMKDTQDPYAPDLLLFFGYIRKLDRDRFLNALSVLDPSTEVKALGVQILALSRNVSSKHLFVNVGFVLFGFGLISFLVAGAIFLWSLDGAA